MILELPILVYSNDSSPLADLGIETESDKEYETIPATVDSKFIVIYYPDKDNTRTIFHLMGEIFTCSMTYSEFKVTITEE